jgi:hypothetical protein
MERKIVEISIYSEKSLIHKSNKKNKNISTVYIKIKTNLAK